MHRLQTTRADQGRRPVLLREVGGNGTTREEVVAVAALGVRRALSASASASFCATQILRFGLHTSGGGSSITAVAHLVRGPFLFTNVHGRAYYRKKKRLEPLARAEAFQTGRRVAAHQSGRESYTYLIAPPNSQSGESEHRNQKRRSGGTRRAPNQSGWPRAMGYTTQQHERTSPELSQLRGRGPLAPGLRSSSRKRRAR